MSQPVHWAFKLKLQRSFCVNLGKGSKCLFTKGLQATENQNWHYMMVVDAFVLNLVGMDIVLIVD